MRSLSKTKKQAAVVKRSSTQEKNLLTLEGGGAGDIRARRRKGEGGGVGNRVVTGAGREYGGAKGLPQEKFGGTECAKDKRGRAVWY